MFYTVAAFGLITSCMVWYLSSSLDETVTLVVPGPRVTQSQIWMLACF